MSDLEDTFRIEWDLHELGDKPAPLPNLKGPSDPTRLAWARALASGDLPADAPLPVAAAQPITFRFGLHGQRWGDHGPAVLLLRGRGEDPAIFAPAIEPLLASGRQLIELEDPTDPQAPEGARVAEFAYAIEEAAVEIDDLDAVVGSGLGAAAAAQALSDGLAARRSVLLAPREGSDVILDSLLGGPRPRPLRLAA